MQKDLQKKEQNLSLKIGTIKKIVGKIYSVTKILKDESEPSIVKIKTDYSAEIMRTLLLLKVKDMVEIIGSELTDYQIKYICKYIERHYWAYKISDMNIIIERITQNKSYGKPKIQDIILSIDEYSHERDELAVQFQVKNKPVEIDKITDPDMQEIYAAFKVNEPEKKEKNKSFREKQKEAQLRYLKETKSHRK